MTASPHRPQNTPVSQAPASKADTLRAEPLRLKCVRTLAKLMPRGRSALVRRAARLTGAPMQFRARLHDLEIGIDLTERVSRTLYLFDDFEADVTGLITDLLKPGQVMLDVGANFGYFSLLAARKVGPTGRVYSFEPDPRNIARFAANIERNHFSNITLVPKAVFNQPGTIQLNMASDQEDNLGSSSIIDAGKGRTVIDVETLTLDDFLPAQNIPQVHLLKMDIEGAELGALQGAKASLQSGRIQQLLLEFHQFILGPEKLRQTLEEIISYGYQARVLKEGTNPQAPLADRLMQIDATWQTPEGNPHLLFTYGK